MYQRPGRFRGLAAGWLWLLMILTGVALSGFVVFHIVNVGFIIFGGQVFDDHAGLFHGTSWLPLWLVRAGIYLVALGLIYHTLNGIRIASKPYQKAGLTGTHARDLKHGGTWLWNGQVVSGSLLAIAAAIHWSVIHGAMGIKQISAATSAARFQISWWVVAFYFLLLGLLLYHTANGLRSVLVKLGFATAARPETRLRLAVTAGGALFLLIGLISIFRFRFMRF